MGEIFKLNHCYNVDCVPAMELFPDNYFDLAVVDPPYFSGPERRGFLRLQGKQDRRTPGLSDFTGMDQAGTGVFQRTAPRFQTLHRVGLQLL